MQSGLKFKFIYVRRRELEWGQPSPSLSGPWAAIIEPFGLPSSSQTSHRMAPFSALQTEEENYPNSLNLKGVRIVLFQNPTEKKFSLKIQGQGGRKCVTW